MAAPVGFPTVSVFVLLIPPFYHTPSPFSCPKPQAVYSQGLDGDDEELLCPSSFGEGKWVFIVVLGNSIKIHCYCTLAHTFHKPCVSPKIVTRKEEGEGGGTGRIVRRHSTGTDPETSREGTLSPRGRRGGFMLNFRCMTRSTLLQKVGETVKVKTRRRVFGESSK